MRSVLVTGSDTGVGKTQIVAALARLLAERGARVQIVKIIETGVGTGEGDAERARRLAGAKEIQTFTLASFPAPLAPTTAAAAAGRTLSPESIVAETNKLPRCDWRLLEGAGGIATPIDEQNHDWADLAKILDVNATLVVVPDRLGAINQARLAYARAAQEKLRAGVCLNANAPVDAAVAASNRAGLRTAGIPLWVELRYNQQSFSQPEVLQEHLLSFN
ncbi:MAG: dethiobiotin synthase, partial [Verrucomicrobiota bacterium]|nr:dethiobiotin synthase [Verrucomicrobiota bacterium]